MNAIKSAASSAVSIPRAVDEGDIVILAIPFKHTVSILKTLTGFEGKVVVSPSTRSSARPTSPTPLRRRGRRR
ncbi:NAD(P)-binding domain-containing protein [Methanoculleus sp.]|uniref:NAD(P)-binding domain-containing protein n=1 Tax=Methanoculleus sp. TaxID=90427 RepID=UPI002FCB3A08